MGDSEGLFVEILVVGFLVGLGVDFAVGVKEGVDVSRAVHVLASYEVQDGARASYLADVSYRLAK